MEIIAPLGTLRLQTTATSRTIRQCIQALFKSKAISNAKKFSYAKNYLSDEKGRIKTENIQILILSLDVNWTKAGEGILRNVLKNWEEIGKKLATIN